MTTVDQLNAYMASWVPTRVSGTPVIMDWRSALSNVDWTDYVDGKAITYRDGYGDMSMVLCDVQQLIRASAHPVDCLYNVDDGASVMPYFVTGWCLYEDARGCNEWLPGGYILLRRVRPHAPHGGLGPRRTWHLLISPTTEVS